MPKTETLTIADGEELKKVKLKTADQVTFEVEPSTAKEMETVQSFIDTDGANASVVIPLPNVTSSSLGRIIEFSLEHSRGADNLQKFDEWFVAARSHDELKELLLAANYLNMKNFFDFLSSSIVNVIKNKSVDFVRSFFDVVNDYTPAEEAEFCELNAWAFEGVDDD
ncbi:SKP protein 1A [Spatholobus suberectus]|nr:SKP protein 1A [Spatholobus suberectus]